MRNPFRRGHGPSPEGVRVVLKTGEEIECLLEPVEGERGVWMAIPVRDPDFSEVAGLRCDLLPGRTNVRVAIWEDVS